MALAFLQSARDAAKKVGPDAAGADDGVALCEHQDMVRYTGFSAPDAEIVSAALAAQLVADLRAILQEGPLARVVFSTGATPLRTYACLREQHRAAVAWERVWVQQLDEYCALAADAPQRFSAFLLDQLVTPLGTQFSRLTGRETPQELSQLDTAIVDGGGLDLVLYGVGVNGHLGFNEPGSSFASATRRVALHPSTRARIDPELGTVPEEAVTLGLATLNAARRVRVVALGGVKQAALTRGLCDAPSPDCPLSSLQGHPDARFFVDAAATPAGVTFG